MLPLCDTFLIAINSLFYHLVSYSFTTTKPMKRTTIIDNMAKTAEFETLSWQYFIGTEQKGEKKRENGMADTTKIHYSLWEREL